jgi:hypothetical protein
VGEEINWDEIRLVFEPALMCSRCNWAAPDLGAVATHQDPETHQPVIVCVGCLTREERDELFRVLRWASGQEVDPQSREE